MSMSKKIRQGKIEIDFQDSALLVNYDVETVVCFSNFLEFFKNRLTLIILWFLPGNV
jgi:hypothetical protein